MTNSILKLFSFFFLQTQTNFKDEYQCFTSLKPVCVKREVSLAKTARTIFLQIFSISCPLPPPSFLSAPTEPGNLSKKEQNKEKKNGKAVQWRGGGVAKEKHDCFLICSIVIFSDSGRKCGLCCFESICHFLYRGHISSVLQQKHV